MDLREEKEMVDAARKDPQAFAVIYDHYYPKILGYAVKRTANVHVAQDITAEAFFKAFDKLWQFRWRNISLSSWLYKIAVNEMNQYFRKGSYRSVSLEALRDQGFDAASPEDLEAEIVEAQEKLERHQDFLHYQKQIRQLDRKYQEVLALRFFEEKPIKEIAEILGKPEGTIKSLLSRGIEQLQPSDAARIVDSERSFKPITREL